MSDQDMQIGATCSVCGEQYGHKDGCEKVKPMTPDKTLEELSAQICCHLGHGQKADPHVTRLLKSITTALRQHLLTYGAHTPVCRGADNCDCGFSEVQKELNG